MKTNEAIKFLKLVYANKDKLELDKNAIDKVLKARRVIYDYYGTFQYDNIKEFIESYVKIVHSQTNELSPFILNRAQKKVLRAYIDNKWLAIPKARQLGMTTLTNALALHSSIYTNNAFVICMAVKSSNAEENLNHIRTMFNTLPEWMKVILVEWNDKDYKSNATQWTFKSLAHNTKSTVETASAASEDSTRGKRVTFLHWTETAFSDIADKVFTSVSPTLRRRPDSRIIMESTGNGATGLYYEVCMGKKDGFTTVFLPWYEDDDYRKKGEINDDILAALPEIIGGDISHLDNEQLLWYYSTSNEMGIASCQQEYPNTVEQVFLSTNKSFFSVEVLSKITLTKPLYHLQYQDGFIVRNVVGPCTVWEVPNPEYEYLISVDTSEGVIDYTSINVFNPRGEEVAYWNGKYPPNEIAKLLVALGRHYNNAWIAIESNGIGAVVLNTLKYQYFYQYLIYYDDKLGVKTSPVTKPQMLSDLQSMILDGKIIIRNGLLEEQMKTFQADTMKAMKGEGIHDDAVMSAAIGAFIFKIKPPKFKIIREEYSDYSSRLGGDRPKRRFNITRGN